MRLTNYNSIIKKWAASAMALSFLGMVTPGAFAEDLLSKPIVKHAAVGAAIGAGAGILSDRTSVGRGALGGALAGAGTGAVTQSRYFKDKPLFGSTLKGAAIGSGASYATGNDGLKGAVLGAGAGAGYHYIRKYLNDR